jgi:GNAT superfamily N-acetyltransferase
MRNSLLQNNQSKVSSAPIDMGHIHHIVNELMPVLKSGLPTPEIKVINQKGNTLGRCVWKYGYSPKTKESFCDDNTIIELQTRILGDESTLRRIISHELVHHEDFLVNEAPKLKKVGYHTYMMLNRGYNGHGTEFKKIANRFNAKYGENYVTEFSDKDMVIDDSVSKPFFVLIEKYNDKLMWQQASRLSPKAKGYLTDYANGKSTYPNKLFMSTEPYLLKGAPMVKYGGYSVPSKDHIELLTKLWDSGEDILPQFATTKEKTASLEDGCNVTPKSDSDKSKTAALPPVDVEQFRTTLHSWVENLHIEVIDETWVMDARIKTSFDNAFYPTVRLEYGGSAPADNSVFLAKYLIGGYYLSRHTPLEVPITIKVRHGLAKALSTIDFTKSFIDDYNWKEFEKGLIRIYVHEKTHMNQFESMNKDLKSKGQSNRFNDIMKSYTPPEQDAKAYLMNQFEVGAMAREAVAELRAKGLTDRDIFIYLRSSLMDGLRTMSIRFDNFYKLRNTGKDGEKAWAKFYTNMIRSLDPSAYKPISREDYELCEQMSPSFFSQYKGKSMARIPYTFKSVSSSTNVGESGKPTSEDITVYHMSNTPNLKIDPNHKSVSGGIGAFYVTQEPEVWKDSLNRKYVSTFTLPSSAIAHEKDTPSRIQLNKWAIENGYMKREVVHRENGDVVYELDDVTPMVRPALTDKAKELPYYGNKDPLRGGGDDFLLYAYLKAHGFSAVESIYSPDGHEIAVFDTSCLTPVNTPKTATSSSNDVVYHGTLESNVSSIIANGLRGRTFVSPNKELALRWGTQRTKESVMFDPDQLSGLSVALVVIQKDGIQFKEVNNDILLAEEGIPVSHISHIEMYKLTDLPEFPLSTTYEEVWNVPNPISTIPIEKTAAPDFGYTEYNDREDELEDVTFVSQGLEGSQLGVAAKYKGNDIGHIDCYVTAGLCVVSEITIGQRWRGTGLGQMLYDCAIQVAKKAGLKVFSSDSILSEDAINAWYRLSKRYPVEEVTNEDYEGDESCQANPTIYHINLSRVPYKDLGVKTASKLETPKLSTKAPDGTPDIQAFLSSGKRNEWISGDKMSVYVRNARHALGGALVHCFDIANIKVDEGWQNTGIFTQWLDYVESSVKGVDAIYVESILNPILVPFLEKRGYLHEDVGGVPCMYKLVHPENKNASTDYTDIDIHPINWNQSPNDLRDELRDLIDDGYVYLKTPIQVVPEYSHPDGQNFSTEFHAKPIWEKGITEMVDPSTLTTFQPMVSAEGILYYLENPEQLNEPKKPVWWDEFPVIVDGLIHEGNHRAVAAIVLHEKLKATVVHLVPKTASPDFGYSQFNNREPALSKSKVKFSLSEVTSTIKHTPNPNDPEVMAEIETIFKDLREAEGEGQCYTMAEILSDKFGWEEEAGFYLYSNPKQGHNGHGDHAWNVIKDGTIVDGTHDQFGPPNIAVLHSSDPEYARYHAFCGNRSCPYCGCDLCNEGFAKEGSHKTPALSDTTFLNMDSNDGQGSNGYAILPEKVEGMNVEPSIDTLLGGSPAKSPQHPAPSLKAAAKPSLTLDFPTFEGFLANNGGVEGLINEYDWDLTEWFSYDEDLPEDEQNDYLLMRAKEYLEDEYNDLSHEHKRRGSSFDIYRCMTMKSIRDLKKKGFGVYWSWDADAADAHWGNLYAKKYTFHARVSAHDVDWNSTLLANLDPTLGDDEKEIRVKNGVPLELIEYRIEGVQGWTPINSGWKHVTATYAERSYKKVASSVDTKSIQDLEDLRGILTEIAQKVYDRWTYEEGGMCREVAATFAHELHYTYGFNTKLQADRKHTWCMVKCVEGLVKLDIPWDVYEEFYGDEKNPYYGDFEKKDNIVLNPSDISIELVIPHKQAGAGDRNSYIPRTNTESPNLHTDPLFPEEEKIASLDFNPSYYMEEGCGIFAIALALLNPGSTIGYISNDTGERWNDVTPEMTHVFCVIPGVGTFDAKGKRTIDQMAADFTLVQGEYTVENGWEPQEFRKRFMGSSDSRPLYGTMKDIIETKKEIQLLGKFPLAL